MADSRVPALTELAETPASGDLVHIVDVSDTTDHATGSSKKVTRANLVAGLASSSHTHTTSDITDMPSVPEDLDDLSDVVLSSPQNGEVLKYNGTNWVNGTDATGGGGAGLTAVEEDTSPTLGGNLDVSTFTVGDADAADLTKLSQLTATATEINYVDGVTSAVQTQLDAKGDMNDLVDDTTPQLGGNLDTNGNDIEVDDADAITFTGTDHQIVNSDTAHGDAVVLRRSTDTTSATEMFNIATAGAVSLNANSKTDGSGNWEPSLALWETGKVELFNTTQGTAGNRYFLVKMTDGLKLQTAGLSFIASLKSDNLTANREFQLPDAGGTILTSTDIIDEDDMTSDSATKVPTQQSVKAYVDASGGGGGSVATDAIFDAKGDLAVGTGANTAARLAAGTDGHVLTLDSAEATGMKWAAASGGGSSSDILWWALPMEDIARYEIDGSGGTASATTTGFNLSNASTSGNYKRARFRMTGTHINLNTSNVILNTIHGVYIDGGSNTHHAFIGLGSPTVAGTGITWTTDHAGWKYVRSSSTTTVNPSVADGTTNTAGSAIASAGDGTNYWHRIIKTGTTSVTFERNGSLLATLTSNVMDTDNQYKVTFATSNVSTAGETYVEVPAAMLGLKLS